MKFTGLNELSDSTSMIPQTPNIILRSLRKTGQMADEYVIGTGGARIGSHPENDIVLRFVSIDNFHAIIEYENERFVLKDLNSESGTFVNGRTVDSHSLQTGLLVAFGEVPFFCDNEPSDEDEVEEIVVVRPKMAEQSFEKQEDTKPIYERIVCPVCEETFRVGEWLCWSCGYDPVAEEQRHDAKIAESLAIQPSPNLHDPIVSPRDIDFEEENNLPPEEDLTNDFFRLPPELVDSSPRHKHSAAFYIACVSLVLLFVFGVVVLILFPELFGN